MSLLERIYAFHSRIQAGQYPNANDLSEEFEISPATAHRDIAYLRDRLLAPLKFDSRKNGYFYQEEGFRLPFEDSPRIVLFLGVLNSLAAEAGLESLPEIKQLKEKLSSMLPDSRTRIEELIHCEWVETEPVDNTIFADVVKSLLQGKQLELLYETQYGKMPTRRCVDPLKMVNYQGRWYLLAWCGLRKEKRLFHLSRMHTTCLTEQLVQHQLAPDDQYLTGVFGIFKGKARFTATIRLTGMAAARVRQQRWHPQQKIEEQQEGIILHLPVADDRELIMKILQFGNEAEVLAPDQLRKRVKDKISAMIQQYV
jgi:predicted DNA-binding transcriptional regulator YafY